MYKQLCYILVCFCANFLLAQDPPPGFDYYQSSSQGFYFIQNITISGADLDSEDWIGVFKK